MESGLFEIQAEHLRAYRQAHNQEPLPGVVHALLLERTNLKKCELQLAARDRAHDLDMKSDGPAIEFAQCFLRLANLPNFALDRLSRYETNLWRQAARILYVLDTLGRRKPQERTRRFW
jgi:hypothetical protein